MSEIIEETNNKRIIDIGPTILTVIIYLYSILQALYCFFSFYGLTNYRVDSDFVLLSTFCILILNHLIKFSVPAWMKQYSFIYKGMLYAGAFINCDACTVWMIILVALSRLLFICKKKQKTFRLKESISTVLAATIILEGYSLLMLMINMNSEFTYDGIGITKSWILDVILILVIILWNLPEKYMGWITSKFMQVIYYLVGIITLIVMIAMSGLLIVKELAPEDVVNGLPLMVRKVMYHLTFSYRGRSAFQMMRDTEMMGKIIIGVILIVLLVLMLIFSIKAFKRMLAVIVSMAIFVMSMGYGIVIIIPLLLAVITIIDYLSLKRGKDKTNISINEAYDRKGLAYTLGATTILLVLLAKTPGGILSKLLSRDVPAEYFTDVKHTFLIMAIAGAIVTAAIILDLFDKGKDEDNS